MGKLMQIYKKMKSSGGTLGFTGSKGLTISNVRGVPQSIKAIENYKQKILPQASRHAMEKMMQFTLREVLKVTPKDTGQLRKTGGYKIKIEKEKIVGAIFFTDPKAVWVHECVTDYHEPPTRAKFIDSTITLLREKIAAVGVQAMKEWFRRLGGKLR